MTDPHGVTGPVTSGLSGDSAADGVAGLGGLAGSDGVAGLGGLAEPGGSPGPAKPGGPTELAEPAEPAEPGGPGGPPEPTGPPEPGEPTGGRINALAAWFGWIIRAGEPIHPSVRRELTMVFSGLVAFFLVTVMSTMPVSFVLEAPGPTTDTLAQANGVDIVSVSEPPTHPITGQLRFTTVSMYGSDSGSLRLAQAIGGWISRQKALAPYRAVYPVDEPVEQREQHSTYQMVSSQQLAAVAALRNLGYSLAQRRVDSVEPDTPADGIAETGDLIVSLDGAPVADVNELRGLLTAIAPGTTVQLGILRDGVELALEIVTADDGQGGSRLGVLVGFEYPVEVTFGIEGVGGPSAGLMLALAIIDKLGDTDLADGHIIAGTGEIDGDGTVGQIGGIRQKVYGALRDGAEYFLVPSGNCRDLVGHVPDGIGVIAVDHLDDALAALSVIREGGDIGGLPSCG